MDSEQDNDNSSVQALEEAPNHMRRVSNAAKPIEVDDSDEDTDEREDEDEAVIVDATERLRKRRRFQFESPDDLDEDNDFYIVASPPNHDVAQPAQAGPSQHHPPPPIPADLLLQVLEILPDLCSEFALRSLTIEVEEGPIGRLVGKVVEMALEMVEGYPKAADLRGKQKDKVEPASDTTYRDGEHRKEKWTGGAYWLRSLISLEESFPRMPVP